MITEKSKKIIQEEMLNLSKEAQEVINAFAWEKISEEIGKKYLLSDDEIETLQLETASFLLGLVDEDAYPKNIEDEVGTSKDEAEKIAGEIDQKIFTPITDMITENIKKNLKNKNPNAMQNLDFILSGGDYAVFMEVPPPLDKGRIEEGSFNSDPLPTSPLLRGSGEIPRKMDDIKDKFTI